MTMQTVLGGIVVAVLIALVFSMTGCANQEAPINQAALAGRAAAQSADTLLKAKKITVDQAKVVLISVQQVRTSLGAWQNAVAASNSAAIGTTSAAADSDLQVLQGSMSSIGAPKNTALGRKRLSLHPAPRGTANVFSANKKMVDPATIITIIQLAADFEPIIVNWINGAFNQTNVTAAIVTTTLAGLDADIATLAADITASGG